MKQIFTNKVKKGAYKVMASILKFPEQVDSRMDQKACRVTVTTYTIKDNIKRVYIDQYSNDHLYQIKVLGIDDKEFLVMQSLLEPLEEVVIVNTRQ